MRKDIFWTPEWHYGRQKQICPENYICATTDELYLRFSQMARRNLFEYTDKIEPYGIDEAWLDVSDSRNLKGSGITIAREISHRIKYELGVNLVQITKSRCDIVV